MLGQLHEKFIQNVPTYLRCAGQTKQASIIEENMSLLMQASKSPDNDYPNYKVPEAFLPDVLKPIAQGTSVIKWEHVYPLDLPAEIGSYIKNIAEGYLKIPFRFADGALIDWFSKAVMSWPENRSDSLWHIGRCCHLVQDISTPVHIAISANLRDVYDVFSHTNPNHERFEQYCCNVYKAPEKVYSLELINVQTIIKEIALKSKDYVKFCDGLNLPTWTAKFLPKFLYQLICSMINDNFDKAAEYAIDSAQKYTLLLMYTFFQTVKLA